MGQCFDQNSFECIDFHGPSRVEGSQREAEICNLPWTQMEKANALAKCKLDLRAWRAKKPILCLHAVTAEDGHPLENDGESGRSRIFQARIEVQRHHLHETILRYDQKAPDDIRWEIDRNEFNEIMAAKRDSAPGPKFRMVSTGVLEASVLSFCTKRTSAWLRVAQFRHCLPRAELCLFPNAPTSVTMAVW